ncbi:sensor histidine kinase [Rummeliibacillus suwonensis]|uniref:sensor histidine kinase n=1 Tax=Rummeliibacillus suwonensis TaxID=1306154 RepID=UPI0011B3B05D|nr:sensor histidine kinase [Rummeliibacillus suwonensis]
MILLFLRERLAWILFFVFCMIWMNILLYLDVEFSNISTTYLNATLLFFFMCFLVWRYIKEMKLVKSITNKPQEFHRIDELILTKLHESALELERYKNELTIQFSEDRDQHLAWIHEVKTPLTAMKLMIEDLPVATRKPLELEWLRIHLLLDQTLHTLRIANIEQDTVFDQFSLHPIVLKEIKELQSWCFAKNLAIDVADLEVSVLSDQKWLSFIIRQILSNAVKYSHRGDTITIYVTTDEKGHQQLHIQDTGEGIDPADLPRIFQKSFTGSMGRKQSASTGMGLYLAQNSAKKLGISIDVHSIVNQGSTFTLTFPNPNDFVTTIAK